MEEARASPQSAPYPYQLAVAIVCDVFRSAKVLPPTMAQLDAMMRKDGRAEEQLAALAHLLRVTSLREALPQCQNAAAALEQLFEEIRPLTAEMIRGNLFRQEELLRKWANVIGVRISGESEKQSADRRESLDYRRTSAEYAKAEAARRAEAKKREAALREAEEKAAAARGWRE